MLGFLRMAKAFTDGNKVYIRFPNDFARSMVDKPEIHDALHASICMVTRKKFDRSDVIYGVFEGDEDSISDLDEFNLD
jgi:hypothetical protein